MVFLMMSGEISFSMVSERQGTGIMSKLSVYGREETKTWPNPLVSMVVLNATFDISGEQKVDWKWYSWVGQAMQFPCFVFFFFKVSEVFHVHNFHKPAKTTHKLAKTSIIVPNRDTSGEQKVDWKWYSWVGQAMQFPCFEVFFFKVSEVFHVHNFHKPAKTSTIASKPYNFLVHSNGVFDDERRNQLFHGTWAAKYWNHVKTVTKTWPKR